MSFQWSYPKNEFLSLKNVPFSFPGIGANCGCKVSDSNRTAKFLMLANDFVNDDSVKLTQKNISAIVCLKIAVSKNNYPSGKERINGANVI